MRFCLAWLEDSMQAHSFGLQSHTPWLRRWLRIWLIAPALPRSPLGSARLSEAHESWDGQILKSGLRLGQDCNPLLKSYPILKLARIYPEKTFNLGGPEAQRR